ncbi:MAG: HD domain-containing protein [Lachnospiraceae bacterium]|nr:HD domain-containing protein [Lachnospiraceae bacterium]
MRYLKELKEGDKLSDIYLCKQVSSAVTKNGKEYLNVILQDKTGTVDAKVWEPSSSGIGDFDPLDYIYVVGDALIFNNQIQVSIKRLRRAAEGEYDKTDYLPVSPRDNDEMYRELMAACNNVKNPFLHELLLSFFEKDKDFIARFRENSAAKLVHHGFVGGLMHHTLAVTAMCEFYTKAYPLLNHDLLISAALLHDIGKVKEISSFPQNDYTDEGQLLGHIVMGSEMIAEHIKDIPDFPDKLKAELQHCILAHHGQLEFGSPKVPELIEAMALNMADNTDAKLETLTELLGGATGTEWLGYNRFLDANIRKTSDGN